MVVWSVVLGCLDLWLVVRIGGQRGRMPSTLQRRRDVHEWMHVAMRTNGEQEHIHGFGGLHA